MNPSPFFRLHAAALMLLLVASGAFSAQNPTNNPGPGSELSDFIRLYQTDRSSVARFYDLPWSEARFTRMEKLLQDWQKRLAEVDFERLNQPGRIDYVLLRSEIRSELSRLALERRRLAEMEELLSFRGPVQVLEQARWKMEPDRKTHV